MIFQKKNFVGWELLGEVSIIFGSVSVEDNEWKFSQNFLMKFPLFKLVKLIIPKHEKNFTLRIFLLCGLKCMEGEAGFLGEHFLIVCHELRMLLNNCLYHREPMGRGEKRFLIP